MNSNEVINYLKQTYGTADWNRYEAVRAVYYDYVRYPVAGTAELPLFSIPRGLNDPVSSATKTLEQTNMEKSGQLPVPFLALELRTHLRFLPKARQVSGISSLARLTCSDATNAFFNSLINLSKSGVLELEIDSKLFLQINQPFVTCPAGFGPNLESHAVSVTGTAVNIVGAWGVLKGGDTDVYALTPPLFLQPEQQFKMTIKFPGGAMALSQISGNNPALEVGVLLQGYALRPLQ